MRRHLSATGDRYVHPDVLDPGEPTRAHKTRTADLADSETQSPRSRPLPMIPTTRCGSLRGHRSPRLLAHTPMRGILCGTSTSIFADDIYFDEIVQTWDESDERYGFLPKRLGRPPPILVHTAPRSSTFFLRRAVGPRSATMGRASSKNTTKMRLLLEALMPAHIAVCIPFAPSSRRKF
jgi:hypothetical protein